MNSGASSSSHTHTKGAVVASRLAGQEKVSFFFKQQTRQRREREWAYAICDGNVSAHYFDDLVLFSFPFLFFLFRDLFFIIIIIFFLRKKNNKVSHLRPVMSDQGYWSHYYRKKENAGIKTLKFISSLILAFGSFPSECIFYFLFIS